ncbi:hypothetical protein LJR255_002143 [Pararhizobium sp. LjRoot255]|uniref:hypothetical protein n=1 Tax=Pararhizobium sp. LjRoot255 TaxID=3342298 RepID=UPI003ED16765
MLNVLIADFFKKEACPRKLGKMRRIRPRESNISSEIRRTYIKMPKALRNRAILPISCDPHMAHRSKPTKISP